MTKSWTRGLLGGYFRVSFVPGALAPHALTPPAHSLSLPDPWEHVFWTGAGVWAANSMVEWEVKLTEEVKAMQAERQAANARFMESIQRKSSKE